MKVRTLNAQLQERAKKQFGEEPENVEKLVEDLRNWIEEQPHLNGRTDDQFLLNWLRVNEFDTEEVKKKIDAFYSMRTCLSDTFTNRDPFLPEIQKALDLGIVLPLRKTATPDGPRIVVVKCGAISPEVSIKDMLKTLSILGDILTIEDDHIVIAGIHAIVDMDDFEVDYMLGVDFDHFLKVGTFLEQGCPYVSKKLDVINCPATYEMLYQQCLPMIPAAIKDWVAVHGQTGTEVFLEKLPLGVVPKDYGGEGDSLDELKDYWKKKVEECKDWLAEGERYVVDEVKRPGGPKTVEEIFKPVGKSLLAQHEELINMAIQNNDAFHGFVAPK